MSNHKCEVVPVVLEKHPDADNLSIVKVWGYQVVVRTENWVGFDRGVYIPPDSICPNQGQFKFLYDDPMQSSNNPGRVRVRKFRGVVSQGLLVPALTGALIGRDYTKAWGIERYVPGPERIERDPLTRWERLLDWFLVKLLRNKKLRKHRRQQVAWDQPVSGPSKLYITKYDVENFNRYHTSIKPGEEVYITEKIHGCSARFVFTDGKFYVGSRTQWKKKHAGNLWWKAAEQNPWIEERCRDFPGMVLYGEVFGQVQDLKYGTAPGELRFLVFDILNNGVWMGWHDLQTFLHPKRRVPLLWEGPFDEKFTRQLAEGQSIIASHCREGVVICTTTEKTCPKLGRKQLKIVSNRYLERGK